MRALVLPIGDDRYGLDLLDVREVVPEPALTPLPGAPRAVLGVINLLRDHAGDAELPAATARYAHGGGVVTLLSLDELLAPERLKQP
jgi:hypothetical protein